MEGWLVAGPLSFPRMLVASRVWLLVLGVVKTLGTGYSGRSDEGADDWIVSNHRVNVSVKRAFFCRHVFGIVIWLGGI